jgi:hypothetical protein
MLNAVMLLWLCASVAAQQVCKLSTQNYVVKSQKELANFSKEVSNCTDGGNVTLNLSSKLVLLQSIVVGERTSLRVRGSKGGGLDGAGKTRYTTLLCMQEHCFMQYVNCPQAARVPVASC